MKAESRIVLVALLVVFTATVTESAASPRHAIPTHAQKRIKTQDVGAVLLGKNSPATEIVAVGLENDFRTIWLAPVRGMKFGEKLTFVGEGQPVGVVALPSGKFRVAQRVGTGTVIVEQHNTEWSTVTAVQAEFRFFEPDGSFWVLDNADWRCEKPTLRLVNAAGENVAQYVTGEEQDPVVTDDEMLTTNGYDINLFHLGIGDQKTKLASWEIPFRNYAFLPHSNIAIVSGGAGVFRLNSGTPRPELVFRKRGGTFAMVRLEVDTAGDVLYMQQHSIHVLTAEGRQVSSINPGFDVFQPVGPGFDQVSPRMQRVDNHLFFVQSGSVVAFNLITKKFAGVRLGRSLQP